MSLPKPPDSVITTLLARALLFLTHATQHSRLNSPLDRMVAIHGLDNSVEYLLRIVVQHLDIEAATGKTLDTVELASLAGEVNRYLKDTYNIELPYLTEIKLIRQVRNLVQHGIVDPQPDLPRYRKIVERFFDRILLVIFGIAHGTLKVLSLVEDTEVRKFVEAAEEFIDHKRYLECVVAARDAFENARHKKTKQTALRINLLPALVESKVDRVNLHYFLTTIGAELELSSLGLTCRHSGGLKNTSATYHASIVPIKEWETVSCSVRGMNRMLGFAMTSLRPQFYSGRVKMQIVYIPSTYQISMNGRLASVMSLFREVQKWAAVISLKAEKRWNLILSLES